MTAVELLAELARGGVAVACDGATLFLRGPRTRLDAALLAECRRRKAELIATATRLPMCCICAASIVERLPASWGGEPCHHACGEVAFGAAKVARRYG